MNGEGGVGDMGVLSEWDGYVVDESQGSSRSSLVSSGFEFVVEGKAKGVGVYGVWGADELGAVAESEYVRSGVRGRAENLVGETLLSLVACLESLGSR